MKQLAGYQLIEPLYSGDVTLVYRGIRQKDELPVAIKLLWREHPSLKEIANLRHEYAIAHQLDRPDIVRPIALERYNNSYALIMEDFGGLSLRKYLQRFSLTLSECLDIAIQLSDILYYLYQKRVIHKDIKPSNILIHPESKQIKLTDFSIASLLPRETQTIANPNIIEGTLSYLSPEQTGRTNRGIDYRSDFYNLGVTLFELLAGELPFQSNDSMELIHWHIAKMPPALGKKGAVEEIPGVLSDIVLKLMAKNPEDRYQSALGIKYDLEICRQQWKQTGTIREFEIARRDLSDRFTIPEKLYGREKEVQALLNAFDRVASGSKEMMQVAGFSGVGKTAVVSEVHKPIVKARGYFIKGKFDQFNRNIPLSAIGRAFGDLVEQLLGESDAQLQQWREKILKALGENAGAIVEIIPELEKIIGKQPAASELSGNAARKRFNLLFQKFVRAIATSAHPLVIFLDDLQWADNASLQMLQLLLDDSESGYLLLIGAYRDNEVSAAHPLMQTVTEIKKSKLALERITLEPLIFEDTNRLIADTLYCSLELARPLAELVYVKTKGNPFFTRQFLKSLADDNWIKFDRDSGCWQCDLSEVRSLSLSDDVVKFMAFELKKLPPDTLEAIKIAACIGDRFDLNALAVVGEQTASHIAMHLWPALQKGLILPTTKAYKFFHFAAEETEIFETIEWLEEGEVSSTYRFLHDRVQQAAYSLIPEAEKPATHLKIGQHLLRQTPPEEREERLFAIVNQSNKGRALLGHYMEILELAKLNLKAGRKAKAATAYAAALEYFKIGRKLLTADRWQYQYELTLALSVSGAEAAYLQGEFQEMDVWIEEVLENATSLLDRVEVDKIQIQALMAQNHPARSIRTALQVLESLGVNLPLSPTPEEVQRAMLRTQYLRDRQSVEELINLPETKDSQKQAALEILTLMIPPASVAIPALSSIAICEQVALSIEYGNSPFSAFAYSSYGFMLCQLSEIDLGYRFGKLALAALERFESKELEAKVLMTFHGFIRFWKHHLRESLPELLKAYRSGLESGDVEYASYSTCWYSISSFLTGSQLSELEAEISSYSAFCRQIKLEPMVVQHEMLRQLILNLMGRSQEPHRLTGEVYDAEAKLPLHEGAKDHSAIASTYIWQLLLSYLFEEFQQAVENAALARQFLTALPPGPLVPIFHFYFALARLALYREAAEVAPPDAASSRASAEREAILKEVSEALEKMQYWADRAPANFQHKYELMAAEWCRVLGQVKAISLYDRAIAGAKENGYILEEALANELAAKFYLQLGKDRIAQSYLIAAYYCYASWGAQGKIEDLERRYPQLLQSLLENAQQLLAPQESIITNARSSSGSSYGRSGKSSSTCEILDLGTILKACQAISSEIRHDRLLAKLTQVLMENAGATKCGLILGSESGWQIEAIATLEITSSIAQPLETSEDLPVSLVRYVRNTLETLTFDDLTLEERWAGDRYVQQHQPKSVLCVPVLKQGNLQAILYLENNRATAAFSTRHLEILNFLSAQISISIENASLYRNLEQKVEKRTAELKASEAKLREAHKLARLGNWEWNVVTEQLYWSDELYQIFGLEKEAQELVVQKHREQIHPEDFSIWENVMQQLVTTGTPYDFDFRIIRPDGEVRYIYAKGKTVKDVEGKVVKVFGTAQDISDRKFAEEALRQREKILDCGII